MLDESGRKKEPKKDNSSSEYIPPIFSVSTLERATEDFVENDDVVAEGDIGIVYSILSKKFESGSLPLYFHDPSRVTSSLAHISSENSLKKNKRRINKAQSISAMMEEKSSMSSGFLCCSTKVAQSNRY